MIAMLMAAALAAATTDAPATARLFGTAPACGGRLSVANDLLNSHVACTDPYGKLPALTAEDPLTLGDAYARFTQFSGLVLESDSLVAPDGVVAPQGELLRVPARPAFAGKLTAPFDARGLLGGAESRKLAVGAEVYGVVGTRFNNALLWCAAISDKAAGGPPDRAVCFSDRLKDFTGLMKALGTTVLQSGDGDNPYMAQRLTDDPLSRPTGRPAAEPVDSPYPVSFPLVVHYVKADKDVIQVRVEFGPYPKATTILRLKRAADGSANLDIGGGRFRLTPDGDGLRVSAVKPVPKDALIQFRPGDIEHSPAPREVSAAP